ncbi:hypothetical protein ANN_22423 [Periplaneta americana]|uniref:Uncharacterized protein n=1 Tax=Periplaneta americana TaxID=6978 RepID=A0ABQ8S843_PERAM|nr:hypothetical protein ANN_22423 [Periplaneta americana]
MAGLCEDGNEPLGSFKAISWDHFVGQQGMVNMWTPQQKVQCVLWLAEEKSVTRVQRRVRTWIGGSEDEDPLPGQSGHPI